MLSITNQRWFIIIGIAFLLVTGLMFVTSKAGTKDSFIGRGVKAVTQPAENLMYKFNSYLREIYMTAVEMGRLREDNKQLQDSVAQLKAENQRMRIYMKENEILRNTLSLSQNLSHITIAAEIIAYNPNNYFASVTINKGSKDGLQEGAVVLTRGGLVGRLMQVKANTSEVMLISDGQHTVGGIVERTRDLVKVVGYPEKSGFCKVIPMESELFQAKLKKGDTIVTWEESDYFPKGLIIGKIESVVKSSNGYTGIMRPTADLGHLQIVLVIKQRRG